MLKRFLSCLMILAMLSASFVFAEEVTPELLSGIIMPGAAPAGRVAGIPAEVFEEVLDALGGEPYRATWQALAGGETVASGTKGETARGVQNTLIAFGEKISADGDVGPKTMTALHNIQSRYGFEASDALDADAYADLIVTLLFLKDEDAAEALLSDAYEEEGMYEYTRGCFLLSEQRYYSAWEAFTGSGIRDWEEKCALCEQDSPKTGEIYHSSSISGSRMHLTVTINALDEENGTAVKIFKDGVVASCLFINGSGSATTKLPGGTYSIQTGMGSRWFGYKDAFGRDGYYEFMTFDDDGATTVQLDGGYAYELTINTSEGGGDRVGSEESNWENFAG